MYVIIKAITGETYCEIHLAINSRVMELKRDIEKATRVAVRFKYNFLGS